MEKETSIGGTLFRYIFFDILLYCSVAFLFFFVIFFVNNILVTIQDNLINNVSLSLILRFFLYSIPVVIANAAPYSAFIGSLMCLGRFVSDYELLSLNSLGLSDKKLLTPVLAVALFLSIFNFFVNDILIPATAPMLNDTYLEMMAENPSMQMQSYSVKKTNNTVIATGEVSKEGVKDILVIDTPSDEVINFLSAKQAFLVKQNNPEILLSLQPINPRLLMINAKKSGDFDYAYGEKVTYNFLLSEMDNLHFFSLGPGQLSSYDLSKKIKKLKETDGIAKSYLNWYNLELQKKFSIPFGALFFILLAYALSRNLRMYNQGVGFVVGLFISVAYWAVMMVGQNFSVDATINFDSTVAAWLPNVLLLIIALVLLLRRKKA